MFALTVAVLICLASFGVVYITYRCLSDETGWHSRWFCKSCGHSTSDYFRTSEPCSKCGARDRTSAKVARVDWKFKVILLDE